MSFRTVRNPSTARNLLQLSNIYQTFRQITEIIGTCQNIQEPIETFRNPSELINKNLLEPFGTRQKQNF